MAADHLRAGTPIAVCICQWEPTVSLKKLFEYLEKAECLESVYYQERPQELKQC